MKKALAMRCNQEQWDGIKDKLVGLIVYTTSEFEAFPYLANNCGGDLGVINNFSSKNKREYNREVHENWNEQIFLEACGIETEKTFKGDDLQVWNFFDKKWENCVQHSKYRIKPDYSKEIEELERQIEILKKQVI